MGDLYINLLFLPHRQQIHLRYNSLLTLYSETVMSETMDNFHHCRYDNELIHIYCKNRVKDLNTLHGKIKIFFLLHKEVYMRMFVCFQWSHKCLFGRRELRYEPFLDLSLCYYVI